MVALPAAHLTDFVPLNDLGTNVIPVAPLAPFIDTLFAAPTLAAIGHRLIAPAAKGITRRVFAPVR